MAKTVSRQPVDFTGCGDSISQKRQDISGTNKQSAGLAERADSRLYQRGKTAEERHRDTEQTRSSNMEARAICQHSSGHTRSVRKGLQRQSLSGFCLPLCFVLVALQLSPIPQTPYTPTQPPSFYSDKRHAGWKRRASEMKWRGKG